MGKAIKGRSIKIVRNENESSGYFAPQEIGDRKNGISRSNPDIVIRFWSIVGYPGYLVNLDVSRDNFCKCTTIFVIVYSLLQVKPRTKTAVTISFQHKGQKLRQMNQKERQYWGFTGKAHCWSLATFRLMLGNKS